MDSVGSVGISKEDTKTIVKEAYREIQEELKEVELTFSSLPATEVKFQPFQWVDGEDKDTWRAKAHLEEQLRRHGVEFGRGHYQLYDVHGKKDILKVEDSQAMSFIASHLTEACVPLKHFVLEQGQKVADVSLRTFKKARVSALEDSVEWEQFQDMLQDSQPGTRGRAEIINQLYRSCDFSPPAFLSMFS
eukprot:gene33790-45249_t